MPSLLKAKGLYSYKNELGLDEGALITADNIIIDRDDIIRPRRGLNKYGTPAPCCGSYCQVLVYKNIILTHNGTKLAYDSDCAGTFTQFSGCYIPTEPCLRIKAVESNGNLYFTTNDGIKKIPGMLTCGVSNFTCAACFIVSAGGPKALDTTGAITYECGGFLAPLSKTAYRVVWGIKDVNKNLILGSPSSRYIISNTDYNKITPETVCITVKTFACVPCSSYFILYDGCNNGYFVWYDKTACHNATEPIKTDTVGKTAVKVNLCTVCCNAQNVATKTHGALQTYSSVFTVTQKTAPCCATLTITNVSGSSVCDATTCTGTDTTFACPVITQGIQTCGKYANVCLTFTVPSDINSTDYFYQVYRTGITTACSICCVPCLEPGDEMNLVFEAAVTQCDITAGTITVQDTTPDCFRESGVLLYTNPVSGDGILQANEKPPKAKDVALFRDSVFYGNTETIQRAQFSMLSVSCLSSGNSKFVVGNSTSAREYTFRGATESSTIATNDNACNNLNGEYVLLNSASNEKKYFFWFNSVACTSEPCTVDTTGRIPVEVALCTGDTSCQVATKLYTAIAAQCVDFTASVCMSTVTVTNTKNGNADDVDGASTGSQALTFMKAQAKACVVAGESFLLSGVACQKYQIYFDCTCMVAAPTCCQAGYTNVEVDLTCDTTAAQVAASTVAAIGALCAFCTIYTPCTCLFQVQNAENGDVDATVDPPCNGAAFYTIGCSYLFTCGAGVPFSFNVTTQGDGGAAGTPCCGGDVLLSNLTSASQSIDESARSLVNTINRDPAGIVNAYYLSGEDDLPGIILLESKNLSDGEFYIAIEDDTTDITAKFSPKLDRTFCIASMALVPCSTTQTRITTSACASHSLVANDCVYIYNTACGNYPFGKYSVLAVCGLTFDITFSLTACTTSIGRGFDINETSDNESKPNRIFYSKTSRPEAVPLVNFLDVGGRDDEIKRVVALRDNLFIMKEDGVYILTGRDGNFDVRLLDNSTFILAPDSAAVLNNQIYMLSSQGVATVSDTGVGVVSRPIEDKILDVANSRFNFENTSFGLGYESDRSYILWVPTDEGDTVATQAYRFNTFNRSWVRWTVPARAGAINPGNDKLYISAGDSSYVKQERKNGDRTDYADCELCLSIGVQCICLCSPTLTMSQACGIIVGDAMVQTQCITISKFNRMLRKLDLDLGMGCCYFTCHEISAGQCLGAKLITFHTALCADDMTPCLTYTAPSAAPSTFAQIRADFNTLMTQINCCSTQAQFNDYATYGACCSTCFESIIISKCDTFNTATLGYSMPFLAGPVTLYHGIEAKIDWAPQHFGDASKMKQISEGTIVFDGNNFFDANIAYSTDLSKDFEGKRFFGQGTGFYGGFTNGCAAFGGEGTDVPYRNLVPRQKQRCRYITVRFTHDNAREDFSILGISLEPRELSSRAYRSIN